MTLGKRIGMLRKEMKISQEAVAEHLGVSRQAVSKWENDLTVPDTENLLALAKLLNVDVEYLASGELTEDMVSDPLPESVEQPTKDRKQLPSKVLAVLLAASIIVCVVMGWLWYSEPNDYQAVEELCQASAVSSVDSFCDFRRDGDMDSYWSAVADFRTFAQSLKVLLNEQAVPNHVSNAEYLTCNQIYGFMLLEPERVQTHMNKVIEVMSGLSRDIYSVNAYQRLYELRNLLEHGD